MSKRRNDNAPWSEEIRRHPNGLDGVIRERLNRNGRVTYAEVMDGANAKRGTAKGLFERLVRIGKADWDGEEGIVKVEATK